MKPAPIGWMVGQREVTALLRLVRRDGVTRFGAFEVAEYLDIVRMRSSWHWSCACGVRGSWNGSWDGAVLVLAGFINSHDPCDAHRLAGR